MATEPRRTGHVHRWTRDEKAEKHRCGCGAWVTDTQMRSANALHGHRYSVRPDPAAWAADLDRSAASNEKRFG